MVNIQSVKPISTSIRDEIPNMGDKLKKTFFNVGHKLMDLCHKGTIFDAHIEKTPTESDSGDIDVVLSTSLEISPIAPVLKPQILNAATKEIRSMRKEILTKTLEACYPSRSDKPIQESSNEPSVDGETFPWLLKFMPQDDVDESMGAEPVGVIPDNSGRYAKDMPTNHVKRRIQRR